jgi:uncharacterized protein
MLRGILKTIAALACCYALGASANGTDTIAPAPDLLQSPERAAGIVSEHQRDSYRSVLDAYRAGLVQHPHDVALAVAQCGFIQRFAWSEDLEWSDAAAKDFTACQHMLDERFPGQPEAALFVLEHRYGKDALANGEPLLAHSSEWTPAQRTRLHAALSRAYSAVKDEKHAGEQALRTVELDPSNPCLVEALRYLVRSRRSDEAQRLLASAPVAKTIWLEAQRINTAAELFPGAQARDELMRARHAGLKIDAYTSARALFRAGDVAGAEAALAAQKQPSKFMTPQNRQIRLDVAFNAGNSLAAADLLRDEYDRTHQAMPLVPAYARLLDLSPKMLMRADLLPLAGALILYTVLLVAAPGLLLFPAHYRGLLRARAKKVSEPLFGRIGLRHAWWALSSMYFALYMFGGFRVGTASLSPAHDAVLREGWQQGVAISYIWSLAVMALGLAWVAVRFSRREWLGSGEWKKAWFVPPALYLGWCLLNFVASRHAMPTGGPGVAWQLACVTGAHSIGGLALPLLIFAVAVPIVEELIFRGCLLGGLSRHISFGWANVMQAALFAALHNDMSHFGQRFVLALIAGWLVRKTKGLALPIAMHGVVNMLFVLAVVRNL